MKQDVRKTIGIGKKQYEQKYSQVDILEQRKVRRVTIDVLKFIPFSFFIIIPGLEFFLPAYLLVFPNSKPSQFISEENQIKKQQEIEERRNNAAL